MSRGLSWRRYDQAVARTKRRLRAGYRGALKQRKAEMQAQVDMAHLIAGQKVRAAELRERERIAANDHQLALIGKEIVRLKLEFGPFRFGNRFVIYARMAEQFMIHGHNLKEVGPVVVRQLARLIEVELAHIDFSRAQPVAWDYDEELRRNLPTYRIEPQL